MNMNQQTATIITAVIFAAVFAFYLALPGSGDVVEPETAIVVDVIEEVVNDTPGNGERQEIPTVSEETPEESADDSGSTATDTPDFLDSFDEGLLEEEFDDVQTGIDLLNNPLQ